MTIVFAIQHPAHVHLFRNSIQDLSNTENVEVVVREKEIAVDLLNAYDIEHTVLAGSSSSMFNLPFDYLNYEYNMWKYVKRLDPKVFVGVGGVAISHVAALTRSNSLIFHDTEHAKLQNKLAFPFASKICTPDCYKGELGSKHIRYPGYHELAYLHPNRFEPDPRVLDEAGLSAEDRFVILRTVNWQALHDIGDSGFDNVEDVVTQLEATGVEVLITAEGNLPDAVSHCQLDIELHRIHDLMAYADLFIGESATMASESALLGTPAVFVSSSRRGYTDELEERYGLVYNFSEENRHKDGLEKAVEILKDNDNKQWNRRRERLLEDKIDTTDFIVNQISSMYS